MGSACRAEISQVARSRVAESVIREIWVRAAGRCVLCSSYLLGGGRSYFHRVPHVEVAHNVGATGGRNSPRVESEANP